MPRLRLLSVLLGLALGGLCWDHGPGALAQERGNAVPRVSPNATVTQTIGGATGTLTYGRPSVRGRDIFGGLVPYGEVWRTGANEATTVSVSPPVQVQGERLAAGTYGLFTIPGPDRWALILNKEANQWGAYNYDPDQDALRVEATPAPAGAREMMTLNVRAVTDTSATAVLRWAETRVPFTITVNTPPIVRSRAAEAVAAADDRRAPLQYVADAPEEDRFPADALGVNRSIEFEEHYQNLRLKAEVLAAREQHGAAVQTAETAVRRAESMEDPPDALDELRSRIDTWTFNQ